MIRKIVTYPDPFLRKPTGTVGLLGASPISIAEAAPFVQMWMDMEDTLEGTDSGAALAANQIGLPFSMFATNQRLTFAHGMATLERQNEDKTIMSIPPIVVDPVMVSHGDERDVEEEGCLSFPGIYLRVPRWTRVVFSYAGVMTDASGWRAERMTSELEGFWARVFQHETDHLNAKLFVDFLPTKKRVEIAKRIGKR